MRETNPLCNPCPTHDSLTCCYQWLFSPCIIFDQGEKVDGMQPPSRSVERLFSMWAWNNICLLGGAFILGVTNPAACGATITLGGGAVMFGPAIAVDITALSCCLFNRAQEVRERREGRYQNFTPAVESMNYQTPS